MMNYRDWIVALKQFIAHVRSFKGEVEHKFKASPPLTSAALKLLDKKLRLKIPAPIVQFLKGASAGCNSHYSWEPEGPQSERLDRILDRSYIFGGVSLCDSKKLLQWQKWCVEMATETWMPVDSEDKALWLRSFPFAAMEQGDFLALDLEHGTDNPPVVYLCHDDESRPLSPSFDDFLREWQRLCYLGPDIYLFESFFQRPTGYLSGGSRKAKSLRALFNVVDA